MKSSDRSRVILLPLILLIISRLTLAGVCDQNPIPAKAPYNTISETQYDQLNQVILRGKGYLTQGWGDSHPCNITSCTTSGLADLHPGVDIGAGRDTAVYSPVGGTVINRRDGADCPNKDGNGSSCLSYVAIYNSGLNKTFFFLHLETIDVDINETVTANTEQIGGVGKRGAKGYHVHYEVRPGKIMQPSICISSTVDPYANTPFSGTVPPPAPPVSGQATTVWNFDRAGDYEGWTSTNASATAVTSGIFFIDPSGDDPYITSPRIGTNVITGQPSAFLYPFIKVKMASNGLDGTGAIYFKTFDEDFYSPDKVVVFDVNNCSLCGTAAFREYTVPMAAFLGGNKKWTGLITGVRLDPTGRGQGGTNRDSIGVDYIRLAGWGDFGGGIGDESGPSLSVNSHVDGQTVNTSNITLSGTASDANFGDNGVFSVYVNGSRAQGGTASGRNTAFWQFSTTLQSGPNRFEVIATDDSGLDLFTRRVIRINYEPPIPQPTPTPAKSIRGKVTNQVGGALSAATINITDSEQHEWQTATDANGNFLIGNLTTGKNYFVTPSKNNFSFSPTGWSIFNLLEDMVTDFSGHQVTFTINGRITDEQGRAVDHVKVELSGAISRSTYTNVNGDYAFNGLPGGGDVWVKAQKPNYVLLNTYLYLGFGSDQVADIKARFEAPTTIYGSGFYGLPMRLEPSPLAHVLVVGTMARAVAEFSGVNLPSISALPDTNGIWPTQLEGVSATVGGLPCQVLTIARAPDFSQSQQRYYIDFVVPPNAPAETNVEVSVKHNPTSQAWFSRLEVKQSMPAFFTSNGTVAGDVVAQEADTFLAVTPANRVATDGSGRVVLYGTGLSAAAARGELNIVGRNAYGQEYILPVEFVGPQQHLPGLDQLILRITPFMAGGTAITIWIIGREEGEVTLPVFSTPRRPSTF
jgi:uncharacterized protein (TIGR03437 family)